MPRIDQTDNATAEVRSAILAPLDAHTRAAGFVWQPDPIILTLMSDQQEIVGGLIGNLNLGWLRIEILAVDDVLRGQGWGRRLMEEAERLAHDAGCHHAWVDTFSFQARPFYERLGYRVFGELPDFPIGESRYFLCKELF